jgi:hypothetical protein
MLDVKSMPNLNARYVKQLPRGVQRAGDISAQPHWRYDASLFWLLKKCLATCPCAGYSRQHPQQYGYNHQIQGRSH